MSSFSACVIANLGVVSLYSPPLDNPEEGPEHELKSNSQDPMALKITSLLSSVQRAPKVSLV